MIEKRKRDWEDIVMAIMWVGISVAILVWIVAMVITMVMMVRTMP